MPIRCLSSEPAQANLSGELIKGLCMLSDPVSHTNLLFKEESRNLGYVFFSDVKQNMFVKTARVWDQ